MINRKKLLSEGTFRGCENAELFQSEEGVYVFIFEYRNSVVSKYDYLDADFDEAKQGCLEDFGIPIDSWVEVDQASGGAVFED